MADEPDSKSGALHWACGFKSHLRHHKFYFTVFISVVEGTVLFRELLVESDPVVVAMKTYSFKVVLEPDEDAAGNAAWYAYCPALESAGGATSGRTREEALSNINIIQTIVHPLR